MTDSRPTKIRFQVLTMATVVAFLMYLDRICLAQIVASDSFKSSIAMEGWQIDWVKGAFFWAYALAQVPAGMLSDRFGARMLITIYIAAWSLFTAATSFAVGFTTLMLARLGCGLAEAGYYPASSGLLTRWAHIGSRGMASSIISWGGRVGGALAPALTAFVILGSGDWRWAGWSYGVFGILVAAAYWHVFREHPRQHPRCNEAEIAILAEGRGDFLPVKDPPRAFPWGPAWTSANLWMANGVQFFTNVGWAFLILSLPDYLKQVKHLGEGDAGWITSVALTVGIAALPLGGWMTDVITRKRGRRLGRMLPMSVTKFGAAACYLVALQLDSPWGMAIAFGAVAFFADIGLPAMWTTMQDISGKYQAQLFGWSNMWGNFGAALQPIFFAAVLKSFDTNHDFHEGVWLCAGAFVLAGLFACFVDAEKSVVPESAQ
ncbi:MAG: MFS transporter [Verrucomicrobiaceae bacterium]|nr:MFS transporter [Verrucomicrobiaceae bacterium]